MLGVNYDISSVQRFESIRLPEIAGLGTSPTPAMTIPADDSIEYD